MPSSPTNFFKNSQSDSPLLECKNKLIVTQSTNEKSTFVDGLKSLSQILKNVAQQIKPSSDAKFQAAGYFLMAETYFEICLFAQKFSRIEEQYSAYTQLIKCLTKVEDIYSMNEGQINKEWIGTFNTRNLYEPEKAKQLAEQILLADLLEKTQYLSTHRTR